MRKQIAMILSVIMIAGSMTACTSNGNGNTTAAGGSDNSTEVVATFLGDSVDYSQNYLKTYFDIDSSSDFTPDTFMEAMKKVTNQELEPLQDLNGLNVIRYGVEAANYGELAVSYKDDKVKERLSLYGIDVPEENGAYVAAAIDAGLISTEDGKAYAKNEAITNDMATSLLMQVADANGLGQNYLGYSDDENIDAKLEHAWNSFVLYDDEILSNIGRKMVENQVTTGYNLKNSYFDANFLPELTLQYGHSDIKHAHQLVALLNSENIRAKVQLEPKISIYEYLLEWGPIPESTPTYEVKKFSDDLYLVYAVEYDLQLEFETKEERDRFDSVIETYAKKYDENAEDLTGLIYGAWWQPLYSTTVDDVDMERYKEIKDCVVTHGIYSIHPFCLPENEEKTEESLKQFIKEEKISSEEEQPEIDIQTRYVNNAFYRYLGGDYE